MIIAAKLLHLRFDCSSFSVLTVLFHKWHYFCVNYSVYYLVVSLGICVTGEVKLEANAKVFFFFKKRLF